MHEASAHTFIPISLAGKTCEKVVSAEYLQQNICGRSERVAFIRSLLLLLVSSEREVSASKELFRTTDEETMG